MGSEMCIRDRDTVGPDHSKDAWEVFLGHIDYEEAELMAKVFKRVLDVEK